MKIEQPAEITAEEAAVEVPTASVSLIGVLSAEIDKARAVSDHAATGALETLHMHAGEFLMRLRAAEGQLNGEALGAVQRLKELL